MAHRDGALQLPDLRPHEGELMSTAPTPGGAGRSVRRFVVYSLLFILVIVAGIGLSGLIGRVLDGANVLIDSDTTGLAMSLAFTLIAGPLAGVLWWFSWRGLRVREERDSVLWGLYVSGMTTVSLIVATLGLLFAVSGAVAGDLDINALATGLVWVSIWVWHAWMTHHPSKSPTRLAGGSRVLGALFGLVVGAGGLVAALTALFDEVVNGGAIVASVGEQWWRPIAQGLVWAAIGALVWWRHWFRDGGRRVTTGFATVVLVLITGLGATALAIGGSIAFLRAVLLAVFEPSQSALDAIPGGLASALVGTLVWVVYRRGVVARGGAAVIGARLATSGVALAATASGVGVIVNAVLAATSTSLVDSGLLGLLLGGVSALVIGAPIWWLVWKPVEPVAEHLARNVGRRVYLITVFGVSALVAIITLLVIAFELFQQGLSGTGDLIENIRAAVGLLVATVLVFVYHFAVWRRDRELVASEAPAPGITRVVLVTGESADETVRLIRELTGASVQVLRRADGPVDAPTRAALAAALDGVASSRVLVLTSVADVEVVPLEG